MRIQQQSRQYNVARSRCTRVTSLHVRPTNTNCIGTQENLTLVHIILLIRHFVQLRSPLAYVSFLPIYVLEPYSHELCNALRRINHITPRPGHCPIQHVSRRHDGMNAIVLSQLRWYAGRRPRPIVTLFMSCIRSGCVTLAQILLPEATLFREHNLPTS